MNQELLLLLTLVLLRIHAIPRILEFFDPLPDSSGEIWNPFRPKK